MKRSGAPTGIRIRVEGVTVLHADHYAASQNAKDLHYRGFMTEMLIYRQKHE
jgi:hypothetical protein